MTHALLHRSLTAWLWLAGLSVVGLVMGHAIGPASAAEAVTLLPLPKHGVQPQTAVAQDGTVHVVFLAGKAAESDVWHATLVPGARELSEPDFHARPTPDAGEPPLPRPASSDVAKGRPDR